MCCALTFCLLSVSHDCCRYFQQSLPGFGAAFLLFEMMLRGMDRRAEDDI